MVERIGRILLLQLVPKAPDAVLATIDGDVVKEHGPFAGHFRQPAGKILGGRAIAAATVDVQEIDRAVVEAAERVRETSANEMLRRVLVLQLGAEALEGRRGANTFSRRRSRRRRRRIGSPARDSPKPGRRRKSSPHCRRQARRSGGAQQGKQRKHRRVQPGPVRSGARRNLAERRRNGVGQDLEVRPLRRRGVICAQSGVAVTDGVAFPVQRHAADCDFRPCDLRPDRRASSEPGMLPLRLHIPLEGFLQRPRRNGRRRRPDEESSAIGARPGLASPWSEPSQTAFGVRSGLVFLEAVGSGERRHEVRGRRLALEPSKDRFDVMAFVRPSVVLAVEQALRVDHPVLQARRRADRKMQEGKRRTDGLRGAAEGPADVVIAFLDAEVRIDEGELRRDRDLADGRRLRQTGIGLVSRKGFEIAVSRRDQIDPRHEHEVIVNRFRAGSAKPRGFPRRRIHRRRGERPNRRPLRKPCGRARSSRRPDTALGCGR